MNPTRYNLQITFGGDESEAPESWESEALHQISTQVLKDMTSGEISIYDYQGKPHRVFWDLQPEDE